MSDEKSKPILRDPKRFKKLVPDKPAVLKPGATFSTAEQLGDDTLGRLLSPSYRSKANN